MPRLWLIQSDLQRIRLAKKYKQRYKRNTVLIIIMESDLPQQKHPVQPQRKTLGSIIDQIEFSKKKVRTRSNMSKSQTDSLSSSRSLIDGKQKSKLWTPEEEELFPMLLNKFGTDFNILLTFFPKKTKNQLKHKYKQWNNIKKKNQKFQKSKFKALTLLFQEKEEKEEDEEIQRLHRKRRYQKEMQMEQIPTEKKQKYQQLEVYPQNIQNLEKMEVQENFSSKQKNQAQNHPQNRAENKIQYKEEFQQKGKEKQQMGMKFYYHG